MVLTSLITIYASESTINSINSYAFHSRRQLNLSDTRHAVNRMIHELIKTKTADITSISGTRIDFLEEITGNPVNFRLDTSGGDVSLFRNDRILVDRVKTLIFKFYDASGNPLAADPSNIALVRRIGIDLEILPVDGEGTQKITTTFVPRSFVGYQKYTIK